MGISDYAENGLKTNEGYSSILGAPPLNKEINPFLRNNLAHNPDYPHNGYFLTRLAKVEFPRFNGTDLKPWLYKCAQFFSIDKVPGESKVALATVHLKGKALEWHQAYIKHRERVSPTWSQYEHDLPSKFADEIDDPMSELMNLRQVGSIQQYRDAFDSVTSRLTL